MGFFLSTPKLDGETRLLQERRACCSCAGLAGDQRSFVVVAVLGKIADLSPCPAHSHVATVVYQRTSKLGSICITRTEPAEVSWNLLLSQGFR